MNYLRLSSEAEQLLLEILEHEEEPNYWRKRFDSATRREDSILRGCFGELKGAKMISVRWADNFPYMIDVLKDGYLYDQHMQENKSAEEVIESSFEQELNDLLDRTKQIREPTNMTTGGVSLNERNRPSAEWVNDVEIFYHKFLVEHPLGPRIKSILFHRQLNAYSELLSCLNSIKRDKAFLNTMHSGASASVERRPQQTLAEFDVFISHANNDKPIIVEDLYTSLKLLGIRIFYDKESLEWGDNWKKRILEGTSKAEFAIIVISENFFDREWTEIELREFLNRQNKNGQKLILPILHGITPNDLRQRYPSVADIQAISSADYTCDQIALLFAKQFIKRLRS